MKVASHSLKSELKVYGNRMFSCRFGRPGGVSGELWLGPKPNKQWGINPVPPLPCPWQQGVGRHYKLNHAREISVCHSSR